MVDSFVNIMLYIGYFLLFTALIAGVILPLINAVGNPGSMMKGLYGLLAIGAIFVVAFLVSGNEVTAVYTKFGIGANLSKALGAFLISMYILMIVSLVGILLTEVIKIFK